MLCPFISTTQLGELYWRKIKRGELSRGIKWIEEVLTLFANCGRLIGRYKLRAFLNAFKASVKHVISLFFKV